MPCNAVPAVDPRRNKLLAALPDIEWKRIQRNLEPTEMPLGRILCEPGSRLTHVYFPTTSIISLVYVTADGASTEIAGVGNEGVVGVSLVMGDKTTPNRVVVQSKGRAYRLKGEILKEEFGRGCAMQDLLLRYTQTLLTLIGQTAVCNRHHSIDQQLCRWLLLSLDRLASEELTMTHELIANMLGVRRAGVTEAADKLQIAGLITGSRGRITVVDRAGIEACCCECYGVVRREYNHLLGSGVYSPQNVPFASAAGRNRLPRDGVKRTCALSAV